jgi:hypothetical protein
MFPARMRHSGVSISYALGSVIGGAFAPMIAQSILSVWGRSWLIGLYVVALSVISFIAVTVAAHWPSQLDLDPKSALDR